MKVELTPDQLERLRFIQKNEDYHRSRFIKATVLVMLHNGATPEDVSFILGLNERTVYRYVKAFKERGLDEFVERTV